MIKDINKIHKLAEKLGISFKNEENIAAAFVHRSFLNESKSVKNSNERLEFLGDSILSLLVSEYLYLEYPLFSEGELTNLRSSVVKTTTLATVSKKLDFGSYLYLSRGEEEGGGRENPSILADTFEAFLGALFLDAGLPAVKKLLSNHLFPLFDKILKESSYKDAKSVYQEMIQEQTKISPLYKVISQKGPDHAKEFTVGVYVDSKLQATGSGKSKQEAEMKAAENALEKLSKK